MNEQEIGILQEDAAESVVMRAGLRALFLSHPNPIALRDAWNHVISTVWASVTPMPAGMPERLRKAADGLEAFLPPTDSH